MTGDINPGRKLSLRTALDLAVAAVGRGDTETGEQLCTSILQKVPENPVALHLMGVVEQRKGNLPQAIALVRKACKVAPRNALFLSNLCEMLRRNGDLEQAVAAGRQAVALAPGMASAHCNLGVALFDSAEFDGALAEQNRAIVLEPNLPTALNNIASILRKKGDLEGSERFFRQAMEKDPTFIEAATNLCTVLIESERPNEALTILLDVLKRAPKHAELHRLIARSFLLLDELDRAEFGFRETLKINPDLTDAMLGLAEVFHKKNHPALALAEARKVLAIDANNHTAHQLAGYCEADLGNAANAFESYDKALSLSPDFTPALLARGYLHMENGDMALATQDFDRVAELKPGTVEAMFSSVRMRKIKPDDPSIAQLEALAAKSDGFLKNKAIAVHYSLAKCYDDIGRYDDAFRYFMSGAVLKRSTITYDADANDRKIDSLISLFDDAMLKRLRLAANPAEKPIFVLGMPRSGTTLTESIIASHPRVFGAGELSYLQRQFPFDSSATGADLAEILAGPTQLISDRIANYLEQLTRHDPEADRLTDKMPANFQLVGLIHCLLPNARIIHVTRDPVDTCVSCFTRLFERSQFQTYDLVELARYYKTYDRLMAHWTRILPPGAFHTVSYEDMVADTEAEARRLISNCGLEWDEACLAFHTTKRRVRTASVTQVRQPVYSSSVAKWKQYEQHLGPLLAELQSHTVNR